MYHFSIIRHNTGIAIDGNGMVKEYWKCEMCIVHNGFPSL